MSKLSNVVDTDVVKKIVYNQLVTNVANVNAIDSNKLMRKADFKIKELEDKYLTTPEFNKFSAEIFVEKLKQAKLKTKSCITNFITKTSFDEKLRTTNNKVTTSNQTKHLEDEMKLIDLSKRYSQIPITEFDFVLDRMYFISNDGYNASFK